MNVSDYHAFLQDKSFITVIEFTMAAHEGQKRDFSGQDYAKHPLRVSAYCWARGMRREIVEAAALHDVLEDTKVTPEQINERFGYVVRDYVIALTAPHRMHLAPDKRSREEKEQEYLDILVKSPPPIHTIKTVDIMDNTIDFCRYYQQDLPRAKRFYESKRKMFLALNKAEPVTRKMTNLWLQELEERVKKFEERV